MATHRLRTVHLPLAVLLFALCLFLYTRGNTFPYFYHPDEPDKVEQVITGNWNFHHPLLLLSTTKLVVHLPVFEKSRQGIAVAGRWVSAAFAAMAVVALTLLAFCYRGVPGAISVGLLLTLNHQFFELSHYLKEDTALLAGIALTFLALAVFWQKPSLPSTACLGAACAIALSGKYVGAVMIPLALGAIFTIHRSPFTIRSSVPKLLAAFIGALLLTVALVNFPVWQNLQTLTQSFGREVELVVNGQQGMTRRVPHAQYWNVFRDNTNPVLWFFIVWHLVVFWKSRRERTLPEWLITIFPFAFAIALSFSPKTNDRYFLPATALFLYLAGLGVLDTAGWLKSFVRPGFALAICIALAGISQLPSFARYWNAFQRDDHVGLRAWIETNLPHNAVILQDSRVGLPVTGNARDASRQTPLIQKVITNRGDNPELATLESVKGIGVTHVIVSQSDYGRYFLKGLKPRQGYTDSYTLKRDFYARLFREGELLWSRPRSTVIYLHPGIEVYRLSLNR